MEIVCTGVDLPDKYKPMELPLEKQRFCSPSCTAVTGLLPPSQSHKVPYWLNQVAKEFDMDPESYRQTLKSLTIQNTIPENVTIAGGKEGMRIRVIGFFVSRNGRVCVPINVSDIELGPPKGNRICINRLPCVVNSVKRPAFAQLMDAIEDAKDGLKDEQYLRLCNTANNCFHLKI